MIKLTNLSMNYPIEGSELSVLDTINLNTINLNTINLNTINLSIDAGETVAIVGPSGSGKTTLLLLLAGLEQPFSGQIILADQDLGTMDVEQQRVAIARARVHSP